MNAATPTARNLTGLKAPDAARSELSNALLRLFSARGSANGEMRVAIVADTPNAKAFGVADGLAFAVLSEGLCVLGDDNDVDHACDVLDAADPVLRHIETILDIALEPSSIISTSEGAFAHSDATLLQTTHGTMTLLVAVAADSEQSARWIEAAQSAEIDSASIPAPLSVTFEAAKLPVDQAAAIESGDMLLLPGKATATWQSPAANHLMGDAMIDLRSMTLQLGAPVYDEEDIAMPEIGAAEPIAHFMVPVTIRLPTQYVEAATLSALREGSSLPLGPLVQGLPVELLVGGRQIAAGEIVEIGDHFAVLVDERRLPSDEEPR